MLSASPEGTPSLFDLFEEETIAPVPAPKKIYGDEPMCEQGFPERWSPDPPAVPVTTMPTWPRNVATDPLRRRYESGVSFVEFVGERSPRGWRAALSLKVDETCEMAEVLALSPLHKTLGDALGTVRHHAMERLRVEGARIHGSFPPPTGSEPDDATALYWGLGREDFRALPDPEDAPAAVPQPEAPPVIVVAVPAPVAVAEIPQWPQPNACKAYGKDLAESVEWRVEGAIARVRLLEIEDGWIWSAEWSTGANGDVLSLTRATLTTNRNAALDAGKGFLLGLLSSGVIRGGMHTSNRAEYDRHAALYRRMVGQEPDPAERPDEMKEAA